MAGLQRRGRVLLAALGLVLASAAATGLSALEPPVELQWHQLVPPAPPKPAKPFFAGRGPVDLGKLGGPHDGQPAPAPMPEGRWMSTPAPSSAGPAPVVEALDGKRVLIGGYVVPLSFDSTKVTDFRPGEVISFWVSEDRMTASSLPASTDESWAVLPPLP